MILFLFLRVKQTTVLPVNRSLFAILFLLALAPRLLFLYQATSVPLFDQFYLDAKSYDMWALELASGDWVGERAFHMAPVYPYLLGLFYKIFGHNLLLLRALQHITGAVSSVLLFAIAAHLFDRRVASLAFLLSLAYGPFIYFEGQLLASFLGIFLGLLGLLLLLRALARGGKGLLLAGLVLGIGSVARPNLIFFMPLVLLWLVLIERVPLKRTAAWLAAFLLALVPTTLYNYVVSDDFIPISSHGGISFYLGNNDFTPGTYIPPPEFGGNPEAIDIYDSRRIAERETGRSLKPSEISNYWYGKSFEYIRNDWYDYFRLVMHKTLLYCNAYEIPLDVNYEFDRELYPVFRFLPVTLLIILPLAIVGAILLFWVNRRASLLTLFIAANAASVIAFFICARYRQTGVPAMIILAAFCLVRLYDLARQRAWHPFFASLGAAIILLLPVGLDLYPGKLTGESRSACIVGRAWAAAGEQTKAEAAFIDALSRTPGHVDGRMNLGLLYYRTGRFNEAVDQFGEVIRLTPRFAGAWSNLGNALRETGRIEHSAAAIRRATELEPGYAGGWNNLGYTLAILGNFDEAESAYRTALEVDPGMMDTWANLADLLLARGKFDDAVATMDRALSTHPESRPIRSKMNQINQTADLCRNVLAGVTSGRIDEAVGVLNSAVIAGGHPVRAWATNAPELEALRNDPRFNAAREGGGGTTP